MLGPLQPEFVAFLASELAVDGPVSVRRFFGGWQLVAQDRQFAIVMAGTLFFRVEGSLREELAAAGSRPFTYSKSDRQVTVPKYMTAPPAALDDLDLLRDWARRVNAATQGPELNTPPRRKDAT